MRGVRQYEGGEEVRQMAVAAPLVVGEAHDLALLFGNQLVAPGEAQKQFGAALVREAGKDRAGERDLAVAQPKFAAGGQAVDAPALLRDQRRVHEKSQDQIFEVLLTSIGEPQIRNDRDFILIDRKSTRLNSSH